VVVKEPVTAPDEARAVDASPEEKAVTRPRGRVRDPERERSRSRSRSRTRRDDQADRSEDNGEEATDGEEATVKIGDEEVAVNVTAGRGEASAWVDG